MQKRILIVTDNLLDQVNGVVTTFANVERQALKNNYKVSYIDPSMFFHFSALGYPEVKISIPFNVGKIVEQINPDYIHIATEGPVGWAVRRYCNKKGYNYNTSYHTKFPEFLKEIYGIPESLTYSYVKWFHQDSKKVLTTTQTMVNELKSNGFTSDVIPWTRGVDKEIFSHIKREETNYYTILYVGRVSKEKGIDDLCKINFGILTVKIQIVGDGPYRKELETKYPEVEFVGYKKGKELAQYYRNADVLCFPSRTDTFGIVMIESMSMGTPVAAYPVAGPIDVIEQGVTGFMNEDLEDAIGACLYLERDDVEKHSKKWTWENCWKIFKNNLVEK